jgi:hypothetical protein
MQAGMKKLSLKCTGEREMLRDLSMTKMDVFGYLLLVLQTCMPERQRRTIFY